MKRTFSTKIDDRTLRLLDRFCKKYHLKKSSVLAEIITEGVRRRMESLELADSLRHGLDDEREGHLYTADEVEKHVFGKK